MLLLHGTTKACHASMSVGSVVSIMCPVGGVVVLDSWHTPVHSVLLTDRECLVCVGSHGSSVVSWAGPFLAPDGTVVRFRYSDVTSIVTRIV